MHVVYESERYVVVHIDAHDETPPNQHNAGLDSRHGFEIVEKESVKQLFLSGDLSLFFQRRMAEWAQSPPTEEQVDEILEGYTQLAQAALVSH